MLCIIIFARSTCLVIPPVQLMSTYRVILQSFAGITVGDANSPRCFRGNKIFQLLDGE